MLIDIYSKSTVSSRISLIMAIAFIMLIGSYMWFIKPHVQYLQAAQRYAGEVDNFAQKTKIFESKLKIKHSELGKLSKQTAGMQGQFFTPDEAQQFLATLEIFAKETNCAITSLNLLSGEGGEAEKTVSAAGITSHRAAISLVGNYPDIVKFLTQITDRTGKIMINPFSLSVWQNNSEKLECSMILTIYVVNDNNSKGDDPNDA